MFNSKRLNEAFEICEPQAEGSTDQFLCEEKFKNHLMRSK